HLLARRLVGGVARGHRLLEVLVLGVDHVVGRLTVVRQIAGAAQLPAGHRLHRRPRSSTVPGTSTAPGAAALPVAPALPGVSGRPARDRPSSSVPAAAAAKYAGSEPSSNA